jgi:hypothetical protein
MAFPLCLNPGSQHNKKHRKFLTIAPTQSGNQQAGFKKIRNLKGGILAWADQIDLSMPKS